MSEEIKKDVQDEELSLDELEAVSGGQITFAPLLRYLKAHDISTYRMIKDGVITATESTRIRADHDFRLAFVDRLCDYLGCQIGDVIAYIPDYQTDNSIEELASEIENYG